MSSHRCASRAWFAVLACMLCACIACAGATTARAAETVTRSLAGVNFTLPADWEEVDVSEGVDVSTGIADIRMFSKNDGVFVAALAPDADLGSGTLEDLDLAASTINDSLADTAFSSLACSAQMEQGVPTLTFYTDDLGLNGVAYAFTLKLFIVDEADFSGGVVMLSLLPASGQVSADIDDLFTTLAEAAYPYVAGISYEIPAGSEVLEGYAFGIDFALAVSEDGAVFIAIVPSLADDGTVTVEDLQMVADALLQDDELSTELDDVFQEFWCGAYTFLGFPTLGFECTVFDDEIDDVIYLAVTDTVTPEGLGVLCIAQPLGSSFAEDLLGSAEALIEPYEATNALPQVSDALPDADPGFVVGVSA